MLLIYLCILKVIFIITVCNCPSWHGNSSVNKKKHQIIQRLEGQTLLDNLKMSITTFQVKDKIIRAEKHSTIEINDEVHSL